MATLRSLRSRDSQDRFSNLSLDSHSSATLLSQLRDAPRTLWFMAISISSHTVPDGMRILAQLTQLSRETSCTEEEPLMMVMPHFLACSVSRMLNFKARRCQESFWSSRTKKSQEVQTLCIFLVLPRTALESQTICSASIRSIRLRSIRL